MPILTTDEGISAIRNSDVPGGFLVELERFAFTEAKDVKLSILDKALSGVPVFQGEIESIEVIGAATIKCNLYIPPGKPVLNSWALTEVGIYLKSGALFAHGTFRTPFIKSGEFGLNVEIYVTCARLGEVINVTVGSNTSLGATSVRSLIEPQKSATNAVIVQDGSSDGEFTSASLALRFGAGGAQWAFVDHHIVYRGRPTSVPNSTSLVLDPGKKGGFWLNDQEIVTICGSFGPGAGRSRRCRYNAATKSFTVLEKPWSITADSVLHVWREHKNILPSRLASTPEHFVLGAGVNSWKKDDPTLLLPAYDLVQGHASLVGNGTILVVAPASIPAAAISQKGRVLVFVGGKRLGINEYVIHDHDITFAVAPGVGVEIGLVYYTEVASPGSYLTMMPAEYTSFTAGEKQFQLAILPESKNGLIVFDNGKYIGQSHYGYEGSSITFTDYTPVGPVVVIASANFYEVGATTSLYSKQMPLPAGVVNIPVEVEQFDKRNTIVSVNGSVLRKDEYTVSSRMIALVQTRSTASTVEVFIAASLALLEQPDSTTSGDNTGPMWVDPAGVLVPPNRLSPVRLSHIGDGIQRTFSLGSRAGLALCFISGVLQDYRTITIDTTNGTAVLPTPVANGAELDVISFEAIPDIGREAVSWRQGFVCDGANRTFVLPAAAAGRIPELTIVSVGGIYIHPSQYTLTLENITFVDLYPVGMRVELWHYTSRSAPGFSSRFSLGSFVLSATKPRHIHCFYGDIPVVDTGNGNNTLLFASAVFQYGTVYTIENNDSFDFIVPGVGTTAGVRSTSVVIFTGRSKSRLLMRDEIRYLVTKREMELAGQDMLGNIDQTYAHRNGDNASGDWNITVSLAKKVKLSQDAGNLIEEREGGLYYGVTAPADVQLQYVDAVNGRDTNDGSRANPVQTIAAATNKGPSGVDRYLYLMEGQDHSVGPDNPAVMRGGLWTINPYGPRCEQIPQPAGDSKFILPDIQAFAPRIISRAWKSFDSPVPGIRFQGAGAFYGTGNAYMQIIGVEMHCGFPNGSADPISSANGTFHEASGNSQWLIRNTRIVFPHSDSRFLSDGKYAKISMTIQAIRLVGPGKLVRVPTPELTITNWGGAVGDNNSSDTEIKSYIADAVAAPLQFSNFTTNLIPNEAEAYLPRDEVKQMIDQAIAAAGPGEPPAPQGLQRSSVGLDFTMPLDRIGYYTLCRWEAGNVGTARMYLNGNFVIIVDVKNDGNSGMYTMPMNAGDRIQVTGDVGSTSNTYAFVYMYPPGKSGWNQ